MAEDINIRIVAEDQTADGQRGLDALISKERQLMGAADGAKKSVDSQSGALRSQGGIIEQLEAKMLKLRKARQQADNIEDITKYNLQIAETQKEINKLTATTEKSGSIFKSVFATLGTLFVADRLIDYSKAIFNTTVETDRLRTAMSNAVGTNEEYLQSIEFLNKLSNDYGQNVNVLTKSYTSFIASSKSSNLSLEERQRIYASVVKAGSALKLSNDDIEGSLRALSQMFSKGNVQAEELRGQLGERLPGAFDMAAKAMGVSTMELNKMLEKGEVLAVDLLPKLATELDKTYGEKAKSMLTTVGGQWNRLTNSIINYTDEVNQSTGFTKTLASGLGFLADNLDTILNKAGTAVSVFVKVAGAILGIRAAVQAAMVVQTLWYGLTQAGTILQGQAALAVIGLSRSTDGLSMANMRAAVAARTFNTALASNPFGVVLVSLTALYGAYVLFKDEAEEARKKQEEFNKGLAQAQAPIIQQQAAFNKLTRAVLDNTLATDEREKALKKLQEEYPNQMKGINSIQEAERGLWKVISLVNGEYMRRIELASLTYKAEKEQENFNKILERRAELEAEMGRLQESNFQAAKIRSRETLTGGGNFETYGVNDEKLRKANGELVGLTAQLAASQAVMDSFGKKSEEITEKLIKDFGRQTSAAEGAGAGTGKANKEIEKALKERLTASDKANADMLKSFDKHQRAYLKAILNGNKEEEKANKDLRDAQRKSLDAQNEYFTKSQYLKAVAQANSISDLKKAEDQYNSDRLKAQMRASDTRIKYIQSEIKTLENIETIHGVDTTKRRTDLYKQLEDAQKQYNSSSSELSKLYISEREEELKEIEDREKLNSEIIKDAKLDGLNAELIARKNFGLSVNRLTEEQLEKLQEYLNEEQDKLKRQQEWREWTIQDTFATVNAIADAALRVFNESIDDQLSQANTATERALLENRKMWVNWGAQVGNVAQAWSKGLADGIVATVSWLAQGVANLFTASKRKAKAELEDLKAYYEQMISTWTDFMVNNQGDIEKYYGVFMSLAKVAQEYTKALSEYDPKFLIENELIRADLIVENYNKAIDAAQKERDTRLKAVDEEYNKKSSAEKDQHARIIQNINDEYNARIDAINKEYDAREARERQAFDAETLAIQENLTKQLLLLFNNEDSKTSIMQEFAEKRSKIMQATALADMEIVDGMDQATINAINEARELRAKALFDLQKWLNTELEWTINNEGQKRKEYTETEKLRLQAEEAIDLANLNYSVAQIQRNKEKNQALAAEEKVKNEAIAEETQRHNDVMLALDQKYAEDKLEIDTWYNDEATRLGLEKDEALKASFEIVKQATIDGYNEIIAKAAEAYAHGAISLQQYRELIEEANRLRATLSEGDITTATPSINEELNRGILALSPTNTSKWKQETIDRYLKFLMDNNLTDSIVARTDFLGIGKFAQGTENVRLGNNPAGVDTVPAMLTAGERVINVSHNRKLGGMSNNEVVEKAVNFDGMYKAMELAQNTQSLSQKFAEVGSLRLSKEFMRDIDKLTYDKQFAAMNRGWDVDMQPVIDRLNALEYAIKKIPIQNFTIDSDGITKFVRKGQSITEYHKKRYGHDRNV